MSKGTFVRRALLAGGGAVLGLGAVAYAFRNEAVQYLMSGIDNSRLPRVAPSFEDGDACIVSAEAIEGPYYIDSKFVRSDVREDRPGMKVELKLKVVDAAGCTPLAGAEVDLWHCDAGGEYSGHLDEDPDNFSPAFIMRGAAHVEPTDDSRFLRGRQTTDDAGMVAFTTIFPGWYAPRTPHMHLRVTTPTQRALLQLYFSDEITAQVFATEPYASRGQSPYVNKTDPFIAQAKGAPGGWPKVTRTGDGLVATLTVGLRSGKDA